MTNQLTDLDLAAQHLREAKFAMDAAKVALADAENKVIELVGLKGDEGSQSTKTEWFKVTTTAKLNRSLVHDALADVQGQVPQELYEQVIQYQPKLSLTGLRACEKANPEAYRAFCQAIVTKPAKAAVKVELLSQKQEAA
jgi:hypothetical protein